MTTSFSQAIKLLESFIPEKKNKYSGFMGLARMKYFVSLLGHPELKYQTIHVGGTSGKGSTATIIASILSQKYKVGLHTSPHLVNVTERIKIQGKDISENEFVLLFNSVLPIVQRIEKERYGKPTYFEILVAMSLLSFYKHKVDFAVVEVGLGGKVDGTNVITPQVAVITNVGLDHTDILGNTVEKIAKEKAGIIKPRVKIVSGVSQSSVIDIVKTVCTKNNAKLSLLNKDFFVKVKKTTLKETVFDYRGKEYLRNLKLNLIGQYQAENAALAIKAIEELNLFINGEIIRKGLKKAYIPGRMEKVSEDPLTILDGAHNGDKACALATTLRQLFPDKKIVFIIAIKKDKDAEAILSKLLPITEVVIFTQLRINSDLSRSLSYLPRELMALAKKISPQTNVITKKDLKEAVSKGRKFAGKKDLIVITGSLYLIGKILELSRLQKLF